MLGLPTWPLQAVITAPLYFDGYGVVTEQGEYGGLIIFDDTVAPQN